MTFKDQIVASGLAKEEEVVGLPLDAISEIEAAQQVCLPAAYRQCISQCGRAAGRLSFDAEFFYPELLELKQMLGEMLVDVGSEWRPPTSAFVFAAYQGFQFFYFICGESDDPPVYRLIDGGTPKLEANSFSKWFSGFVASYAAVYGRP